MTDNKTGKNIIISNIISIRVIWRLNRTYD